MAVSAVLLRRTVDGQGGLITDRGKQAHGPRANRVAIWALSANFGHSGEGCERLLYTDM